MAKNPPNPTDKHIGARVRMRRMKLGTTQVKLANALGVSCQQLQKYEQGANRIGASRLQQIASTLRVPASFFFEGLPQPQPVNMRDAPWPAYLSDFLTTSDGLDLIRAFMRLKNAKMRKHIVALVKELGED